jgi:hypothetical protein
LLDAIGLEGNTAEHDVSNQVPNQAFILHTTSFTKRGCFVKRSAQFADFIKTTGNEGMIDLLNGRIFDVRDIRRVLVFVAAAVAQRRADKETDKKRHEQSRQEQKKKEQAAADGDEIPVDNFVIVDGSSDDDSDDKGPSSKKQKKVREYLGLNADHRKQYELFHRRSRLLEEQMALQRKECTLLEEQKAQCNKMALNQDKVEDDNAVLHDQVNELTADNKQLVRQLSKQVPSAQTPEAHRAAIQGGIPPGGYMSTKAYGKLLKDYGLMDADQDVFHIIAALHGGVDHVDNFIYALGSSFNRSIGNQLDPINCFLAGKAKAKKAVERAVVVAINPRLRHHIDKRNKPSTPLYTNSIHRYKDGDELYAEGQGLMKAITREGRAQRTGSAQSKPTTHFFHARD